MKFSDLKIGERFKGLDCVYLKVDEDRALVMGSLIVISVDWDDEVEIAPKVSNIDIDQLERETLQELVWNAIETMQTDGNDRADNLTFGFYCGLYQKLGGIPPVPIEPKISPAARQSAIGLADDLIDIARKGGMENDD